MTTHVTFYISRFFLKPTQPFISNLFVNVSGVQRWITSVYNSLYSA